MEHTIPPLDLLLPEEAFTDEKPKVAKRKMLFIMDGYSPEEVGFISLPSNVVKYTAVKHMPYIVEYEDGVGQSIDLLQQYRFLHHLGYLPKQKVFVILLNPFSRLLECDYAYYRPFVRLICSRHVVPLVVMNPADYIEPLLYVLEEYRRENDIPHIEVTTSPAKAKQLVSRGIVEVLQGLRRIR